MSQARSQNLTSKITEELGTSIVTGQFNPDAKFPTEAQLCEKFTVSRSIMREAVKMLTTKGLLSARPRQGTKIEPEESWNVLDPDVLRWLLERQLSYDLLIQFNEVRLAIEPAAAATAAARATPESVAPIYAAINQMINSESNLADPLTADIAFHVAVLKASGNRFFIELQGLIEAALRTSIRVTHQLKAASNVRDHKKVLDAIAAKDPETAKAAMAEIIIEAMELIAKAQKKGERAMKKRIKS